MVKRLVGITFMSDKEEEDQTANVDTDVLGQFGHKKRERRDEMLEEGQTRKETNRKPEACQ